MKPRCKTEGQRSTGVIGPGKRDVAWLAPTASSGIGVAGDRSGRQNSGHGCTALAQHPAILYFDADGLSAGDCMRKFACQPPQRTAAAAVGVLDLAHGL
jgi:hypothetical protein